MTKKNVPGQRTQLVTEQLVFYNSLQVKGYRVYYTKDPSQPINEWQIHNVQDSLLTTIQNLVTSETYTIQVLAFTSVGDGPFSDPVHVKVLHGGE